MEKVADGVEVSFDVTNTGKKDAMETAQVYVHDVASSVLRPYKELKGFDKKMVRKGKTVRFSVRLGPDAFSFYDVTTGSFKLEPGEFEILAGPSSADLPLKTTIVL